MKIVGFILAVSVSVAVFQLSGISISSACAYARGSSDNTISAASMIAKILTVLFFMMRNLSILRTF